MDPDDLTERQRRFVEAYLVTPNATLAYKAAGYACITTRSAANAGHRMLKHPKVSRALARAQQVHILEHKVDQDFVVHQLMTFAGVDITYAMNDDGKYKPLSEWPPELRYCIKSITFGKHGIEKVDFVDKMKAVELLGKHVGMFVDKTELTLFDGDEMVRRLQAGRDRVALMGPTSIDEAEVVDE